MSIPFLWIPRAAVALPGSLTSYLVLTKFNEMNAATVRLTADERRSEVVAAATREFAARGFAGTSTQAIADRAGVSQPYLFQLFGTKKDLFLAAVRACFGRTRSAFEASGRAAAVDTADPTAILLAMGHTYVDLLGDRDMLRLQLQSYAACEDPEIQAVVREEWTALYEAVARASGADAAALHAWFAEGMLLNVAASIGDLDAAVNLKLARGGGDA
jgi:AcrR family transcriptional regulator